MEQKRRGTPGSSSSSGTLPMPTSSSLTLPTANTARQHLGSKKKSDSKQIHPGYSMFDWNKLCSSGRDMTGTGGRLLKVTPEELARHCTDNDLWTAVRGVVYNITMFTKYHPGGKAQLMRGAGQDCTEIFDKIHVWVNSEAILENCIVGYLVGSKPPVKSSNLSVSIQKPPFPGNSNSQQDGEDVLSLSVPDKTMSISDAGTKVEEDSDEESELSIPVPTFSLSNEQPDGSANDTPIPATSISISVPNLTTPKLENTSTHTSSSTPERTDISIPVPILTTPQKVDTPSVPNSAPVPDISIPVPSLADRTSLPVSKPNSVPVQKPSGGTSISGVGRIVGRYVSTHPLISSTAYETAV